MTATIDARTVRSGRGHRYLITTWTAPWWSVPLGAHLCPRRC